MGHGKTVTRLERLELLTGLLRSGDYHTAVAFADELCVSTRTLMRDLEILKEKGYPIETEQGRGGGIRLHHHWGIGRLQLNYREVIDLLLSLAVMEKIGSPMFFGNVKAIRQKISVSFPQEQRGRIQDLQNRNVLGSTASEFVLDSLQETPKISAMSLYQAFFEKKIVKIAYRDVQGRDTQRVIEAQYLFLHWPAWYILSWDHLREDVRCFRLDRVVSATIQKETFRLRRKSLFIEDMEDFISNL